MRKRPADDIETFSEEIKKELNTLIESYEKFLLLYREILNRFIDLKEAEEALFESVQNNQSKYLQKAKQAFYWARLLQLSEKEIKEKNHDSNPLILLPLLEDLGMGFSLIALSASAQELRQTPILLPHELNNYLQNERIKTLLN